MANPLRTRAAMDWQLFMNSRVTSLNAIAKNIADLCPAEICPCLMLESLDPCMSLKKLNHVLLVLTLFDINSSGQEKPIKEAPVFW